MGGRKGGRAVRRETKQKQKSGAEWKNYIATFLIIYSVL